MFIQITILAYNMRLVSCVSKWEAGGQVYELDTSSARDST